MNELPFDLQIEIAYMACSTRAISNLARTCSQLHSRFSSNDFWKRLLDRTYTQQEQSCFLQNLTQKTEPRIGSDIMKETLDTIAINFTAAISVNLIHLGQTSVPNPTTSSSSSTPAPLSPKKVFQGSELWKLTTTGSQIGESQNSNFTLERHPNLFVKQMSFGHEFGCAIDINDELWVYKFTYDPQNDVHEWENTHLTAKTATAGNQFCLFVDLNDFAFYYIPFNKKVIPVISMTQNGVLPVKATSFAISKITLGIFAVATTEKQVLIYQFHCSFPDYLFNIDVREMGFTVSHFVLVDKLDQVQIVRLNHLYSGQAPTRSEKVKLVSISQGCSILRAKSVKTHCTESNAVIIGLDNVVSKLIISGDNISVNKLVDNCHLGLFVSPCSLGSSTRDTIVLQHDKTVPLAKISNSYLQGRNDGLLLSKDVFIDGGFCWVVDEHGSLSTFSKNLVGGTRVPMDQFRVKCVSNGWFQVQR